MRERVKEGRGRSHWERGRPRPPAERLANVSDSRTPRGGVPTRSGCTGKITALRARAGFSLMEVNMAVFVMAVGILSMVALYPLGLRESVQGQQDLTQSMFADYLLNQAVAAASMTNFPWSQWKNVPSIASLDQSGITASQTDNRPPFMTARMRQANDWPSDRYRIICCRGAGGSDRIMGIMVRSTEIEGEDVRNYTNNPVYYAEAYFQGDVTK